MWAMKLCHPAEAVWCKGGLRSATIVAAFVAPVPKQVPKCVGATYAAYMYVVFFFFFFMFLYFSRPSDIGKIGQCGVP